MIELVISILLVIIIINVIINKFDKHIYSIKPYNKYLVFGGEVASKNNGDIHFVQSEKVAKLYCLSRNDVLLIDNEEKLRSIEQWKYFHLMPEYEGLYNLKEMEDKK